MAKAIEGAHEMFVFWSPEGGYGTGTVERIAAAIEAGQYEPGCRPGKVWHLPGMGDQSHAAPTSPPMVCGEAMRLEHQHLDSRTDRDGVLTDTYHTVSVVPLSGGEPVAVGEYSFDQLS